MLKEAFCIAAEVVKLLGYRMPLPPNFPHSTHIFSEGIGFSGLRRRLVGRIKVCTRRTEEDFMKS